MKANGKLGVIIPEIADSLDFALLEGMYAQAQALGYDLLIFTGVYNTHSSQGYNEYRRGLDNIFSLPVAAELDAVIFAGDRFISEDIIKMIDDQLRELDIPKIMVHHPMNGYINVSPVQEEFMYRMTKHLTDVHGFRKIWCLAGIPDEIATMERLSGFRRAMVEVKQDMSDETVIYGYFWKDIPYQLGLDIASGAKERPEAVLCQNDVMAAALIKGLQDGGLRVPEDIAVTGYDGNWRSSLTEPQITTITGRDMELGAFAVLRTHEALTGEKLLPPTGIQKLSIRQSCGCDPTYHTAPDTTFLKFTKNMMRQYYNRKDFITADFMTSVTTADSVEALIGQIKENRRMISSAKTLDICLCEDWKLDFADTSHYRKSGFSDHMISLLSGDGNSVGKWFPTEKILPDLMEEHEPSIYVFTSLFCRDQILGYTAASFREISDICIDEYFANWCDTIANGFRIVQEKLYRDYVQREMALHTLIDPATGILNKRGLLDRAEGYIKFSGSYEILLIARKADEKALAESGYDTAQFIANAIRLTSDKSDIYARLSDDIFCIIMNNAENAAELRVLTIERSLHAMQGTVRNLLRSELISDTTPFDGSDKENLEDILIQRMQILNMKVSGAIPFGNTLKEQLFALRHDIWMNPEKQRSIESMARQLGVSVSHFQHSYKTEFSVSCMDDVIRARLEKAKQLLQSSGLLVSEVADRCGYQSVRHFTRQFTQAVGVSPTAYKKQIIYRGKPS